MPAKTIEEFDPNLKEELTIWAIRVFDRVKKNFITFNINRMKGEKGPGFTGNLYRTIHWTVHNAAGGNQAMVDFFYMKYGDFVQWGVGWDQKSWDIPQTNEMGPITAPNGRRKAKQFLRREVKYHARWLLKRLLEEYGYRGNLYVIRGMSEGMGDPKIMEQWIEENKDALTRGAISISKVRI